MEEIEIEFEADQSVETTGSFWRRRWKVVLPLGLSLAGLVAIMAWGMVNQSPATGQSGATRPGKAAPDFNLVSFAGEPIALSDYRGNPVIVNFWASWCGPCRLEAPALERAWRRFRDEGVVFVGIDIQDTRQNALDFLEEFDITYPNGPEDTGLLAIEYGVGGIPVTFFIDREGIVARRFVGALNDSRLVAWVEDLLVDAPAAGETEGENLDDFFELDG